MKVQVKKLHTLTGHRDSIYTLEKSSVEHVFFSAAGDGMVVMWDLNHPENGKVVAKLPNSIYSLHHHRSSDLLIAGHNYDGIHLIDWQNKKEVKSLQLTKAAIFDIQSSGDNIYVGTGDGTLVMVDIKSLTIKGHVRGSSKSVRAISISEARHEIAVGYSDHFIRIFDLHDLTLKTEWIAHANSVFTLRYSPDGRFLYSGSRDARLKVWNVGDKYALQNEVVAHLYAINHLDFSPDGKHFVTCSMDKSVKVWDTVQVSLLKVIDKSRHAGHGTSVNKVLWTSFHDQLLSASDDRSISIWNITFENQLL
ncbi:MAG: WD40 repeat domain-containing protein [Chryseolinea sp.]